MKLPVNYEQLTQNERKTVRDAYVNIQNGKCFYCGSSLFEPPPQNILNKKIKWRLFPINFLKYPIHLQHNHKTGMTEGAVHAYCNAVMWRFKNR